ncbi:protein spire homolog 1-like [Eleutherodactylus coqui]|uniref:protein spire homolog 1-like n=1 Tax=Eleutherodactylus coqui TaxID=57060 RepID=UPI003462B067
MLGLHTPSSNSPARRIAFTLNDIIKECVERLFVPSEASAHYRDVCRSQYAEYKDIHRLLRTIQVTKQSLTRLDSPQKLKDDVLVMYNWGALWSRVMNELRLGVRLRSVNQRTYNVLPVQYTLTPYERLMDDIRLKRYVLRPVEIWTRQNPKDDSQDNSLIIDDNMDTTWSNVMHELRLGVGLRSDRRSYPARPVEYTLTPYELLMEDIRSKRYVLRPVKNKSSRSDENVMDLIRTFTLKPASDRKLKERSEEEPSLHDLLMSEIKSSKTLRSTWDIRSLMQDEVKVSINLCPAQREYSLYSCRTGRRWRRMPVIEVQDLGTDGRGSWHRELSYESSSEQKFSDLTSSSTELSFFPMLTSSQVDLRINSISNCEKHMSYSHRRSNSCEGSLQGGRRRQSWRTPNIRLPPTISELIPLRRSMVKSEMLVLASSKNVPGYKACSSCYQKRLFFSWIFSCRFCDRIICPKCHIEMLMPFKQCMNLPVSFFKALVLTRENDPFCQSQKNRMFLREVMHWDYSSIPLVFEPKDLSEDLSFCKRITYNWTSMDICIKCEEYILDLLDTSHQSEFRDSSLKSRSMSESSVMLLRH